MRGEWNLGVDFFSPHVGRDVSSETDVFFTANFHLCFSPCLLRPGALAHESSLATNLAMPPIAWPCDAQLDLTVAS